MSTVTSIINRLTHGLRVTRARGKSVAPIGSTNSAWARYCINYGHSFRTYTLGYELLVGADCTDQGSVWQQRGFAALAEHVGRL